MLLSLSCKRRLGWPKRGLATTLIRTRAKRDDGDNKSTGRHRFPIRTNVHLIELDPSAALKRVRWTMARGRYMHSIKSNVNNIERPALTTSWQSWPAADVYWRCFYGSTSVIARWFDAFCKLRPVFSVSCCPIPASYRRTFSRARSIPTTSGQTLAAYGFLFQLKIPRSIGE